MSDIIYDFKFFLMKAVSQKAANSKSCKKSLKIIYSILNYLKKKIALYMVFYVYQKYLTIKTYYNNALLNQNQV